MVYVGNHECSGHMCDIMSMDGWFLVLDLCYLIGVVGGNRR